METFTKESMLPEKPTLGDYQNYVLAKVKGSDFEEESLSDVFMLFQEECGGLARAARKSANIKTNSNSEKFHAAQEAANVFNYLMQICNRPGIDLEKAFREKEEINKKRIWK